LQEKGIMITCKKCHKAIKSDTTDEFCKCCYPEPEKQTKQCFGDCPCKDEKTDEKEINNPEI